VRVARPVDLDPRDYRGTYKLIGGAHCLDFVNLVSYRGTAREHDWLDPAANVQRWVAAAGIDDPADGALAEGAPASAAVADGAVAVGRGGIDALRRLRESMARVLLAVADHEAAPAADVAALGRVATGAWHRRRLVPGAGGAAATWDDAALDLRHRLALDAATLITSPASVRDLRACDECRWLFLDATRNRSRRWCDPADCGNRVRQRRHQQRATGRATR
jgi:predicted RNA-binding Zn ribbon-like protein